ncbi:putative UBX domain-containing protein 1 [Monocercomonoides exilis]|uniref:putative UBX domain-containing protein 1 n=1 Tax=Monocercomonoides exilis TaxID=2049356 RepID=UPI003559579A|nr:putative UBX domain-containing protein 1 [Monocercomonoides exilis]|eukprot:MONOS_9571.1-p1 / transcript=MONOS_9571.1 / gene=MONOS_9571 / organism=Monocercomonoides_exilis_PA203 / gene_product=UBX domain-containing protein 1 A (Ubx1A) / transcript_product=UBX domain-containing protein 1 A (Ubx1A) / location=Mono_scaffold00400:13629-15702(-) / protein_length=401 / sequence_SO=supercontig / SO=protein_coding / is_pseudo=false
MNMQQKEEEFIKITGKTRMEAKRFLALAKGDLETAISYSFGDAIPDSTPEEHSSHIQPMEQPPPKWGSSNKRRKGFKTMADVANDDSQDDDDDTQRYMSTDGQSGRLTIDPSKKEGKEDIYSKLLKQAKPMTEEQMHRSAMGDGEDEDFIDPHFTKKGSADFWKMGGSSLGSTDTPSVTIDNPSQPAGGAGRRPERGKQNVIMINMYKNGFTVNDGPLHSNENPQTQQYLAMISAGQLPPPLVPAGATPPFTVSLNDRRGEEAPKPPRDYFQEQGHSLGGQSSAQPSKAFVGASARSDGPSSTVKAAPAVSQPTSQPSLSDLSQEEFMVQCRFESGQTQRFVFNKFSKLRELEIKAQQVLNHTRIEISQPFPRKVYTKDDMNKTLAELNMKNASVIIRAL